MAEHGEEKSRDRALRLALLGEIAGEAAHELRNALAVIGANAQLLSGGADPAKAEAYLAKIQRNARLAQELLDNLLALARGEPVRPEVVRLADAVGDARQDMPGTAQYVDDFDPEARVNASPVLLSRVFRIFYENAIQATAPRAPSITTRARPGAGAILIEVSDDGPGVPEAIHATLFEPLVSERSGGTGLGLALARRTVRAHGGEVELVASERGACFRVRLPL